MCVWLWCYASILRPDRLTQPPVSRTRQMGDIKRSMPWQGSLSKLGRTVTGVMFWQGIKCLLRRRPVCHSTRLMYRYRWLYNACLWRFCMLMPWFLLFSDPHLLHVANDCSKSKSTLTPKHLKVLDNYLFYFSYVLLFSTIHLNCILLHFCNFLCTFRSCLCNMAWLFAISCLFRVHCTKHCCASP